MEDLHLQLIATDLPQVSRMLPKTLPTPTPSPSSFGQELPPIPVGTQVKVQDPISRRWNLAGIITRSDAASRNYEVRTSKGRRLWRNRRHLLPSPEEVIANEESIEEVLPPQVLSGLLPDNRKQVRWDPIPTRTSTRNRKPPNRLIEA